MNDEDYDDIGEQKKVLADQDLSDEFQIKMAMLEFYEVAGSLTRDNEYDKIDVLLAKRNVIMNMIMVYLLKFNNKLIVEDFAKAMKKEMLGCAKDGKISYYDKYMADMRVIGTFLGIRENIADKLAKQTLDAMMQEEQMNQEEA